MRYLKLPVIAIICVLSFAVLWVGRQLTDNRFLQGESHAQLKYNSSKTPVKVLLLSYLRSGSSFTGKILSQSNNSFYVFEPLHAMEWYYQKLVESPVLMNGTRWPPIVDGYQMLYIYHVLQSILHCKFKEVDERSLLHFSLFSKMLTAFKTCSKTRKRLQNCLQDLASDCEQAPVSIIKTIRTPMKLIDKLLDANPSLKIVHLFRDPRGHFTAWWRYEKKRPPAELAPYLCNRIWEDVQERKRLERKYPDNFMEVVYEDLVQNTVPVVRNLYKWLGVDTHPKLFSWLRSSTNHAKDGSSMDTFRQNSTKTAYAWVSRISNHHLNMVNKHCSNLIHHGKFPQINNFKDKFTIPNRIFLLS